MKPLIFCRSLLLLVLAFPLVLMSGCATHSYQLMQKTEQQTREQTLIARVASGLKALETRIAGAQANDVAIFAPHQMEQAESALQEARSYYDRFRLQPHNVNKSISLFFGDTMGEKALALISQANQALSQAERNKQQADQLFAESNENFKWLRKFQAASYFPYEFQDIVSGQKDLVRQVANGRIDSARAELPQLLREQRALEVASAQRYYLADLENRMKRENRYELTRYAELSYRNSMAALNTAKAVIANNSRDEAAILKAKANAAFSFEVAHAVAADMQKLMKMDRREMERWLLLLTHKLHQAGQYLGGADLRNQPVIQQIEQLSLVAQQQPATPDSDKVDQVAENESEAPSTPAAAAPEEASLENRVADLEKSLSEQIKALSKQLQSMQATTQQVSVPSYEAPNYEDDYVPLGERKSLFFYR